MRKAELGLSYIPFITIHGVVVHFESLLNKFVGNTTQKKKSHNQIRSIEMVYSRSFKSNEQLKIWIQLYSTHSGYTFDWVVFSKFNPCWHSRDAPVKTRPTQCPFHNYNFKSLKLQKCFRFYGFFFVLSFKYFFLLTWRLKLIFTSFFVLYKIAKGEAHIFFSSVSSLYILLKYRKNISF